jgi:hypothetical protein
VELVEIVRGVAHLAVPLETEPLHVGDDGVDEFLALGLGVGVVEAQVAGAAVLPGEPEIQTDRLGVPDMQVTVGLGGKARHHPGDCTRGQVLLDDLLDEIAGLVGIHRGPCGTGPAAGRSVWRE